MMERCKHVSPPGSTSSFEIMYETQADPSAEVRILVSQAMEQAGAQIPTIDTLTS
jgi:hypothetical protein